MVKNRFTNKSNIRLGFEVECVIDMPSMPNAANNPTQTGTIILENYYKNNRIRVLNFRKEISALNKKIQTGRDVSINKVGFNYNAVTVELKTPPLPPKSAMELLEKVFEIVNKYGGTNKSCGFHVNISSNRKSDMRNFNPISFSSSKIWKQILTEFKRKRNSYCMPTFSLNKGISAVEMVRKLSDSIDDKYHCVNFSNFKNGKSKYSRVEIRGMGNSNYTKKYNKIAKYVYRIQKLFKLSCNDFNFSKILAV